MNEGNEAKQTMNLEMNLTGTFRTTWMYNIEHDMNECGLEEENPKTAEMEEVDIEPRHGILAR